MTFWLVLQVWSFLRTIYHLNELLTTFDLWVADGRIPDYGEHFLLNIFRGWVWLSKFLSHHVPLV